MKLPDGFTVRAPTVDDAQAITDLMCLCDIDEFGQPESGIQDLRAMWRRKNFDLATDAWMIFAPDETLAGYCDMHYGGELARLNNSSSVHPGYKNCGIQDWFLQNANDWAREHVRDEKIILRHVVNAGIPAKMERMTRWGYKAVRHALIMRIVLTQLPPQPMVSNGIVIRAFERGQDEYAAWACIQEAFRDLWQHQDVPYDEWASFVVQNANWTPELSFVAFDGDELVGTTLTMMESSGGWIQQVAVRRPWRGRGIGLALLHTTFGALYGRGLKSAGLEVDAENPSGALRLYERAGMHVSEHFTEFRKELE